MKIKLFFIFLLVFLGAGAGLSFAADTGLSLVTSPLPINLVTTPGSTVSAQLKIKNGGEAAETLTLGLMKFSAYGDDGKPRLLDKEKGDDYFDWVSFSENDFVVNPNEWKTITMTIKVPPTAAFGYYYAVTFSRKSEEIAGGPRSTKVIGATATLVLLEVRVPNAIRNIEVLQFSTPQQIYEFLPVTFTIKLKNKGNVHVVPKGNIFIDRFGDKKDTAILVVNDLQGNILPDSNRIFETAWSDGFPVYQEKIDSNQVVVTDKNGKPVTQLKWDFSQVPKLRWGKYTANLLLVYDDGSHDVPIEGKLTFWVIPWRIIGGAIGLVVANAILGVLIFKLVNWLRNRKNKK